MNLTEEHNINKNEITYRLGASSDFGDEHVFEIRAVYRKKDRCEWKLCSALISKVDNELDKFSEQYKENSFFIVYVKFSNISQILLQLYDAGIEIDSRYPSIKLDEKNLWTETLIPSWCSHLNVPIRHLSTSTDVSNYGDEPLIGHKLTYYSSFNERLKEFIRYEKSDRKCIHLLLEDRRALLDLRNDKVILNCMTEVSLVGQIEHNKNIKKINIYTSDSSPIDIKGASSIELWVVGENNLIHDYISSTGFPYRYDINKPAKTIEENLLENIKTGETVDCEFKKFIDISKGDSKSSEIDKTVCAFSNTDGGSLIIGVTDNGEIVGVDEQVRRKYKKSLDEAINEYLDSVRKRLYENLTINDCFTINVVDLLGKKLIVVNVNKSEGWNFLQVSDVPYARKGATNFNATRLVSLELISKNNRHRSTFQGGY